MSAAFVMCDLMLIGSAMSCFTRPLGRAPSVQELMRLVAHPLHLHAVRIRRVGDTRLTENLDCLTCFGQAEDGAEQARLRLRQRVGVEAVEVGEDLFKPVSEHRVKRLELAITERLALQIAFVLAVEVAPNRGERFKEAELLGKGTYGHGQTTPFWSCSLHF